MKGSAWWRDEVPEQLGDGYTRAVLEAVEAGDFVLDFVTVTDGDFEFEIVRAPLAIGEPDDHVFLLGLSGEAVDMIALALKAQGLDVMSPTPALWDVAAEDARQVQVGPHTLPTLIGAENGAAGMTKTAAKAHADALACDDAGGFMCASIKCYVLHPYADADGIRDGHCAEYGWRLDGPVGWGSTNSSGSGYLVQPAQWAHAYRAFFDYSMGGIYVKTAARHGGEAVNLAELALAGALAPRVAPAGAVPFVVHPECRPPLDGLSEPPPDTLPAPASGDRPLLVRGSKGPAVEDWQAELQRAGFSLGRWGVDGSFGKLTHNGTVGWQRERGLEGSGAVDADTWAAIGTAPVERDEPDDGITAAVPATNYTHANRATVDNVVIHTIEIVEASYSADRTAAWFGSGARAPRASAHYCLDDDSTIMCVPEEHVAWAAPGLNRVGIQLEHAGFARQSADEWFDPFSRRMLARSAKLAAAICARWGIPVVFVSAAELLEGKRGITTHYQVTKGPGKGRTTHTDPGRGFPMSTYLDMVREAMA